MCGSITTVRLRIPSDDTVRYINFRRQIQLIIGHQMRNWPKTGGLEPTRVKFRKHYGYNLTSTKTKYNYCMNVQGMRIGRIPPRLKCLYLHLSWRPKERSPTFRMKMQLPNHDDESAEWGVWTSAKLHSFTYYQAMTVSLGPGRGHTITWSDFRRIVEYSLTD